MPLGGGSAAAVRVSRVGAQLAIQRCQLDLERVDHRHRDGDLLARRRGQRRPREPRPALNGHQPAPLRAAVVIEHGLDALLPLAALIDQRVTQPHTRAHVEQVIGRDPRLRQPRDHQQLAQMPRVRAV
jgi:hypothetical protein